MTREELEDKMKDLSNPSMRVHLIQQVYDIMNEENENTKRQLTEAKEIIRDLLEWQKIYGVASHKYVHRCNEARDFLNSEVTE